MKYSVLGTTGVKVSRICLGTATFGVAPTTQDADRVVGAAIDLMQSLAASGKLKIKPDFGQLQGMADELGCSVLQRADTLREKARGAGEERVAVPLVYKSLTWGSVQECMQYLLRRAIENSGGTARMKDGYAAYLGELKRRMGQVVRLRT